MHASNLATLPFLVQDTDLNALFGFRTRCRTPGTTYFIWAMTLVSVLTAARVVPFDKGTAERDVIGDEMSTGREIKTGEQVGHFQSVSSTVWQSGDALSLGNARYDESSSRPLSRDTGEAGAFTSISCKRYHAGIECRFFDGHKIPADSSFEENPSVGMLTSVNFL